MSIFILKIIAILTMTCDHIACGFFDNKFIMRAIGRTAFVVYAFLLAESFRHIKDSKDRIKVHFIKLLFLAIISEITYMLFNKYLLHDYTQHNVIITLLLAYISLLTQKKKYYNAFISISMIVLATYFKCEYGGAGVLLVIMFYYYCLKQDSLKSPIKLFILLSILTIFWMHYLIQEFSLKLILVNFKMNIKWYYAYLCSLIPLVLYNNKLGYHSKTLNKIYSIYYPVHFFILVLVKAVCLYV